PPQPYSFGYDNTDEFGTRMTRHETGDEFNNKVGSYSYVDALGVARTVNYVADAAGFRVNVDTNEPGTKTSTPAHAQFLSSAVEGPHPPPQPYSFGYDNTDEFGTRMTRHETGDEFNNKVGSYSYVDALGVARTVNYVADAAGFRVNVDTNEPGTKTSTPAHAQFLSSAVEGPHPVLVKAVHAAPVAVPAVHGAPVVHAAPFAYARHAAPLAYNFGHARLPRICRSAPKLKKIGLNYRLALLCFPPSSDSPTRAGSVSLPVSRWFPSPHLACQGSVGEPVFSSVLICPALDLDYSLSHKRKAAASVASTGVNITRHAILTPRCVFFVQPPQPYSFGYDNTDEFGTRMTRQETGDEFNNKVGSYSYVDALGVARTVNYVADAAGFRVNVDTNEPGTKTSTPAHAQFLSSAVEGPHPVLVKAVHAAPVAVRAVPVPQPYSFGYYNIDEFGTRLTRQETGDEFNNKVGSYGYVDAHGIARTVNYVADALGFRATVETNEPGTKTSVPADAPTYSSSVEVAAPVVVNAVHPAPVVVKAVHPAPVVVKAVNPAPVVVKAVHPAPAVYTHKV
ncbi:unnamed protein product, partial [Ixodes persulcatus]